jgi:hypothetical protein
MGKKREPSRNLRAGVTEADGGDDRSPAPDGYAHLLKQIKDRIQQSQARAIFSVNAELIRLY